jgi:hypothetical protein
VPIGNSVGLLKQLLINTGGDPADMVLPYAPGPAAAPVQPPVETPVVEPGAPVAAPAEPSPLLAAVEGAEVQRPVEPVASAPRPQYPEESPYGKGLTDADLARAYLAKRQADSDGRMMNAVALINKGFGGSMPSNAGDAYRAGGDSQVQEILARRQGVDADLKAKDSEFARRKAQYLENPEAAPNQFVRSLVGKYYPDLLAQYPDVDLDMTPKEALAYDGTRQRGQRNAMGGEPLSPDAALVQARLIGKLRGWDQGTIDQYAQALQVTPDGKDRRKVTDAVMGSERLDQSDINSERSVTAAAGRQEKQITIHKEDKFNEGVQKLSKQIPPELAAVRSQLTELQDAVRQAKTKYGEIPGVGMWDTFASGGRLRKEFISSPEANKIRNLVNSLNILNRTDITGAAFGEQEASDLKQTFADTMSAESLDSSLGTLASVSDAKLNAVYAGYDPEVVKTFLGRVPQLGSKGFSTKGEGTPSPKDTPSAEVDAAAQWLMSEEAKKDPTKAQRVREKLRRLGVRVEVK